MTFGENLKAIRKRMKLTQQEMADRMDISRTYLSDLENTRRSTSINTVLYIAKRLDISVNELVNDNLELTEYEYNKRSLSLLTIELITNGGNHLYTPTEVKQLIMDYHWMRRLMIIKYMSTIVHQLDSTVLNQLCLKLKVVQEIRY